MKKRLCKQQTEAFRKQLPSFNEPEKRLLRAIYGNDSNDKEVAVHVGVSLEDFRMLKKAILNSLENGED